MRLLAVFLVAWSVPCLAEPVEVPSGQSVEFIEVIRDAAGPEGLTYRFRFLAPGIARTTGTVDLDTAAIDMDHLCRVYAMPRLAAIGPVPEQIIVSMSDRPVEFGLADPEATQFFEAYRIEDGSCIWEGF